MNLKNWETVYSLWDVDNKVFNSIVINLLHENSSHALHR